MKRIIQIVKRVFKMVEIRIEKYQSERYETDFALT